MSLHLIDAVICKFVNHFIYVSRGLLNIFQFQTQQSNIIMFYLAKKPMDIISASGLQRKDKNVF